MGDILGGIIGGIGSLIGGSTEASNDQQGVQNALTGYRYLNNNPLVNNTQANANTALAGQAGTTGAINSLLTSPSQNNPAYQNYLNSTGYNFQLQQGSNAITGNSASKGLLDSGATAKALTGYGQNLASTTFGNYLGQLGGLAGLQGQQVGQGLTATGQVGQAGTTGGGNAANMQAAAGQALGTSQASAANMFGGAVSQVNPGNFFLGGAGGSPSVTGTTLSGNPIFG